MQNQPQNQNQGEEQDQQQDMEKGRTYLTSRVAEASIKDGVSAKIPLLPFADDVGWWSGMGCGYHAVGADQDL